MPTKKSSRRVAKTRAVAMLAKWLEDEELTHDEAGEILDCHRSYIGNMLRCLYRPGRKLAVRIEKAADIPVAAWEERV